MKAADIKEFGLSLPNSEYEYKMEWDVEVGLIGRKIFMHKTFISYHHKNEQDLKDEIITKGSKEFFIDKSVKDGDIDTKCYVQIH